jgi:predicted TIM-barrel fold metal-dependent hydrolase
VTTRPTTPGPASDADVPAYVEALGLPGLADVHVHFLPDPMQEKVWAYFDAAEANYGRPWPVAYRGSVQERLAVLRALGLRAVPALTYPHKPGMARWLNAWGADFARRVPDAVHCATLYPEEGVGDYVREALAGGARLFKMHVQVGRYAPDDPLLDPAWAVLAAAQVPVVIHAGSAPLPGEHTGPGAVRSVLDRHPGLVLVIAHLGMPEYHEFADLAETYPGVHLDTTMAATDFTEATTPMPTGYAERLGVLRDKVVLGSDFPSIPYPYAHQVQALARLDLGDDWMRAVLWHNGARLLGLDQTTGAWRSGSAPA